MTLIKFCGMTREDDVRRACELGVHALGFVMWPGSPRYVDAARVASLVRAITGDVTPVGVFVSPDAEAIRVAAEAGIRVVQVHGTPRNVVPVVAGQLDVWVATSLDDEIDAIAPGATLVLDAHDPVKHGGTGRTIDWAAAARVAARRRVMLAGGLTSYNVATAIRQVRPYGVDVASGIEDGPGQKNAQAMAAFVSAAREASE